MINEPFLNEKKNKNHHGQIKNSISLIPQDTCDSLAFLLFRSQEVSFPSSYKKLRPIYKDAAIPALCNETWGDIPMLPLLSHQDAEARHLLVYQLCCLKEKSYSCVWIYHLSSFRGERSAPCQVAQIMCISETQQLSLRFLILWCSTQKVIVKKKHKKNLLYFPLQLSFMELK